MPWAESVHSPEGLERPVKWRLDKGDSKVYVCSWLNFMHTEEKVIGYSSVPLPYLLTIWLNKIVR